jgi:hypothetical protein
VSTHQVHPTLPCGARGSGEDDRRLGYVYGDRTQQFVVGAVNGFRNRKSWFFIVAVDEPLAHLKQR